MPLTREELDRIAAHDARALRPAREAFWEGTRDHDVRQNIDALLRHMPGAAAVRRSSTSAAGPAATSKTFTELGHVAIGLEGSPRFAAMARAHSGCEVWEGNLLDLSLPPERFDGVFANAALFHVPGSELPRVLRELHATLKPGGVLFSSNPRGEGQEGWQRRALRRVPRPRRVARIHGGGRLRRAGALLPARAVCRASSSPGWRASGNGARRRCERRAPPCTIRSTHEPGRGRRSNRRPADRSRRLAR